LVLVSAFETLHLAVEETIGALVIWTLVGLSGSGTNVGDIALYCFLETG
jgi:hypothetical protein